jgi:hypothetical protein
VPPPPPTSDASPPTKSVTFIPLSPQSSRTLLAHRQGTQAERDDKETDDNKNPPSSPFPPLTSSHADDPVDDQAAPRHARNISRRLSDPSANRPPNSRRRPRGDASPDSNPDEDDIEVLPDRFDASGRPFDTGGATGRGRGLHSRHGDFEYRSPRRANGWNTRGQWAVSGTDGEAVERIVQGMTGALEGRGSWLGLLGGLLSGSLLEGPARDGASGASGPAAHDDGHRLNTSPGTNVGAEYEEDRERKRERSRIKDRDRNRDSDGDRDRDKNRDRDKERNRERNGDEDRDRERDRERYRREDSEERKDRRAGKKDRRSREDDDVDVDDMDQRGQDGGGGSSSSRRPRMHARVRSRDQLDDVRDDYEDDDDRKRRRRWSRAREEVY